MASISWFSCLHIRPTASADNKGLSSSITVEHHKTRPQNLISSSLEEVHAVNRRQLILYTSTAAIAASSTVSNALALNDVSEEFSVYTDDENKFKIEIPQEWKTGTGESAGFKSLTAFYPKEESNSNVSVVITGVGPDFTKMESFGKVEEFADTLVSGLDRSWKKPPGVAAKLIDCKSSKGFYFIEYTLQNPGESRKHLYSAIGMLTNGWYNRLYTVTGQYGDEETDKYASKIQKFMQLCIIVD
ncbi:PsbP domain-containing protein 3 [Lathyrus oleraceus]|uniref:PsbP domain-containing protein 3 n=1 Tax=Pisum sativum TaxID=3888 RepID=A0A9D4WJ57_PEA|nr:PsbP domain-containing protein 3 [Pisum sativum]